MQVLEILSPTELRVRALNSKALGQRKNVNLPGESAAVRACDWNCAMR